eukprot:TRINITY_DN3075_c1_g1_i1.p1 TRINITY_DN3075_c1_g1~~TRINITY_DN3075_c1_g1_i1.p1  ORF type:complete len:764 (+),score=129.21 TRINITY_DN3075_c1_g1_i1:301-2592(+)
MAVSLELRQYQKDCVDQILKENTIVVLPTGSGKTLVAVKCIDHLRLKAREERVSGSDRVMFIVPTVDLVYQQADYCEKNCEDRVRVARLCSADKMGWRKDEWDKCLEDNDVLVGTPEIFSRALTKFAYIKPDVFCFVIFDECHNAVGNSPMVTIAKDSLWRQMDLDGPPLRIAGFTASPCKESLQQKGEKVEQAIFVLQQTLQSKIFSPSIPEEFQGVSASDANFHHVDVPAENIVTSECGRFLENWLEELLDKVGEHGKIKDVKRILRRLRHVFDELGRVGFLHALEHNVVCQLQATVHQLMLYTQDAPKRRAEAEKMEKGLPELQKRLSQAVHDVNDQAKEECPQFSDLPEVSFKVTELINILTKELKASATQGNSQFRCLVLVHEKMLPRPLVHILMRPGSGVEGANAAAVCGTGSMNSSDRHESIEQFRSGKVNVIVSTPALEEGLDVPECNLVVRFNKFNTAQSHIQGSGRARHANAKVFCFENDPLQAQAVSKRMTATARNPEMRPRDDDQEDLRQENAVKRARLECKHPFGGNTGAEVSVFNCRDIFYAYCAKVLKDSFRTDALYQWAEDGVSLLSVTYPTPDGPETLKREEVASYWDGVNMKEIFDPVRSKRYGTKDKEMMRFLFLVVKQLRDAKHMDPHNQPTVRARELTPSKCPQQERPAEITINAKYPKIASSSTGLSNPKGVLKEWCDRTWREKGDAVLKYETKDVPGGFRTIVNILKLKLRFEGDTCQSKKLAEQAAASKALQHQDVGPR